MKRIFQLLFIPGFLFLISLLSAWSSKIQSAERLPAKSDAIISVEKIEDLETEIPVFELKEKKYSTENNSNLKNKSKQFERLDIEPILEGR